MTAAATIPTPHLPQPDSAARELSLVLESLLLAAAKARLAVIETLQTLMANAGDRMDPVEQRRAAATLLRATQAPLIPLRRDEESGLLSPASRAEPREATPSRPTPSPRFAPRTSLTPEHIVNTLCTCLGNNDAHEANSGLATLAAFLDDNASANGEPLPTPASPMPDEDSADLLDDLADHAGHGPLAITLDAAWSGKTAILSNDGHTAILTQHFQSRRSADNRYILRFTLERRQDSRRPDCFLITRIDKHTDSS